MLSCRLARAFRSLTSRRISFWGISLSPRFPVSTSDSLAKATLKKERKKVKRKTGREYRFSAGRRKEKTEVG